MLARPLIDAGAGPLRLRLEADLARFHPAAVDIATAFGRPGEARIAQAGLVITGARSADGAPAEIAISVLRRQHPHLPIYICAATELQLAHRMPQYVGAGADEVILLDREGGAFLVMIAKRLAVPPPEIELRALAHEWASLDAKTLALHCIRNAYEDLDLNGLSYRSGASVGALNTRLKASGLPTAKLLGRCGRELHACELERRVGGSGEHIARVLGFESGAAHRMARLRLRRALASAKGHGAQYLRELICGHAGMTVRAVR